MGDRTAFFYGTLMAPEVLHRVIYGTSKPQKWQRDLTTVRPAMLHSYRRHRVLGCDYPAIMPCESSTVRGSLVTGLTEGDIFRLDIFEGEQYDRKRVKVQVLKGIDLNERAPEGKTSDAPEEVEAESYVWKDSLKDYLDDEEWDFDEFAREKMRFWMGEAGGRENTNGVEVDEAFADVDRAVAEAQDKDPTGGRGMNGAISKQLESTR